MAAGIACLQSIPSAYPRPVGAFVPGAHAAPLGHFAAFSGLFGDSASPIRRVFGHDEGSAPHLKGEVLYPGSRVYKTEHVKGYGPRRIPLRRKQAGVSSDSSTVLTGGIVSGGVHDLAPNRGRYQLALGISNRILPSRPSETFFGSSFGLCFRVR